MTGTNHVLTGIAIAVTIKNPIAAPFVAFLSHFALDMVPHFGHPSIDPGSKHFVFRNLVLFLVIDACFCFTALFWALLSWPSLWLTIILSTGFATLPDFMWIAHYGYKVNSWFFDFAKRIQVYEKPPGLVIEVIFAILIITLLISHTI